ncbi:MAG: serine protease, partial [Rickettsiales bacterium]|nr:serine protease [Rickettsiales bacterium]
MRHTRAYFRNWLSTVALGALALCALYTEALANKNNKLSYAVGTGFYVTHDGYLITANHVIANCSGPISVHGQLMV